MPTWNNEDGLLVRFPLDNGAAEALDGSTSAEEQILKVVIADATVLVDADTAVAHGDRPYLPAGAFLKEAQLVVDTAFTSGGSAVMDIGLKQAAGTTIDDDGIDAAIAVAGLVANASFEADGALVGTKMVNDSYVTVTFDTAAFTAGAATLYIKYVV